MEGFQKITAAHAEEYKEKAMLLEGMLPSTLYFESIYAWSHACEASFRRIGSYFCIRLDDTKRKKRYFYMPVGAYEKASFAETIRELWKGEKDTAGRMEFRDVGEAQADFFRELSDFEVEIRCERRDADYIFAAEEFGKRLESRECRYNRKYFQQRQTPECRPFAYEDMTEIREVLEESYCKYHTCADCNNGCLKKTAETLLAQQERLQTKGVEVFAEGRMAGYIACVRWKDTLMVLFKKNIRNYRGLDEFLHAQMLERFRGDAAWINYTEDMGIPGLRNYKEKWGAYCLNNRYRIYIRAKEGQG